MEFFTNLLNGFPVIDSLLWEWIFWAGIPTITNLPMTYSTCSLIDLPIGRRIELPGFFTHKVNAKVALHSLTASKMSSKCSFTTGKLRFFGHFCLVMKYNPTFVFSLLS